MRLQSGNEANLPIIFVRRRYDAFGGGELILERTLSALADQGRPVAILSSEWPRKRPDIGFIRCAVPRAPRSFRARAFARAACRTLATIPAALVQANDRLPCCDVFRAGEGVHAAYLEQRRRHERPYGRLALSISPFHREAIRLEKETFASPRLKAVIAISRMVADDIARFFDYPAERVHHIPNGVDLARFSLSACEPYRVEMRRKLGLSTDQPVILFIGSGFARKGLAQTMDALKTMSGKPELWVVGHDARPAAFLAAADRLGLTRQVRLLGAQSDPLPWYAAADVSVLPSIYEPFGSTVLEAMACGLPTVVSASCGARELVERFDGRLVRDNTDTGDLASGLELALELSRQPGTAERVRAAAEHYGLDRMVSRMVAVYSSVISERASDTMVT